MNRVQKRFMVLLLTVVFLMLGAGTVFAAGRLTKKDFTKSYGKYKVNYIKYTKKYRTDYYAIDPTGEEGDLSKVFSTKRKICLNSTKKQVFKKYGKTALRKFSTKTDYLYIIISTLYGKSNASAKSLRKCKKYADYSLRYGGNEYRLRFYFNKSNKVQCIALFKNYALFTKYPPVR